jgi:hypothetical protein
MVQVIERGHIYDLEAKNGGDPQRLTFVKSLPEGALDNHDGVMGQEVVRALIDRELELFAQQPCQETMEIIQLHRRILKLYEVRAFGNTLDKSYKLTGQHIEELPVSKRNGHLFDPAASDWSIEDEDTDIIKGYD